MTEEEKEQLQSAADSKLPTLALPVSFIIAIVVFMCTSGVMSFLLAIGIMFVGAITGDISMKSAAEAQRKLNAARQEKFTTNQLKNVLEAGGVPDSVEYYEWPANNKYREFVYFFKYATPKFVFLNTLSSYAIPLSAIVRVQIETTHTTVSTTTTQGGVKRAIIGGAIAGGAGAVVGGSTADTVTNSQDILTNVWVKINTTNLDFPVLKVFCDSIDTAESIEGTILALKSKYENVNDIVKE